MSAQNGQICVYEWMAWDKFLLQAILPTAVSIRAALGETSEEILSRIPDDCSCFVFHINLTDTSKVPADRAMLCERLRARGAKVFNARATSIAKSTVQQACRRAGLLSTTATRQGEPGEMLLAKTDRNAYGYTEHLLSVAESVYLGIQGRETLRRYVRLPRQAMPDFLWDAPDVVIEKYVENWNDLFYRVYAMGSRSVIVRVKEPGAMKRLDRGVERTQWFVDGCAVQSDCEQSEYPSHIAHAACRFREVIGLDFCTLDVVQDSNGGCYIIDANSTPSWRAGEHCEIVNFLAAGLFRYA
jgi:hypothetical protein